MPIRSTVPDHRVTGIFVDLKLLGRGNKFVVITCTHLTDTGSDVGVFSFDAFLGITNFPSCPPGHTFPSSVVLIQLTVQHIIPGVVISAKLSHLFLLECLSLQITHSLFSLEDSAVSCPFIEVVVATKETPVLVVENSHGLPTLVDVDVEFFILSDHVSDYRSQFGLVAVRAVLGPQSPAEFGLVEARLFQSQPSVHYALPLRVLEEGV